MFIEGSARNQVDFRLEELQQTCWPVPPYHTHNFQASSLAPAAALLGTAVAPEQTLSVTGVITNNHIYCGHIHG